MRPLMNNFDNGMIHESNVVILNNFSATIETRRGVFDLATSINDLQIAVVENTLSPQVTEESVVRLYDVGR